jgi:hypothetical protein
MSDGTPAAPAVSMSGELVSRPAAPPGELVSRPAVGAAAVEVAAHGLAAFVAGSVSTYVVARTSPEFAFGLPFGLDVVYFTPELVALLALGFAFVARLGAFGWLVSAIGLLGNALLYAQGDRLDGEALLVFVAIVAAAQVAGLLHAFDRASGMARRALAVGFAAGVAGGTNLLGILAGAVHDDAAVLTVLGVLVAAAGAALLVIRRSEPVAQRPVPWWAVIAVTAAGMLAIAATRGWGSALNAISNSHIGGISEQQARQVQTWDQLARVGAAMLVAAVLAVAALWWGQAGAARWVAVGFSVALVSVGVNYFFASASTWAGVVVGVVGAAAGLLLVRTPVRAVPWDAVGLVLATGLLLFRPPSPASVVGWFGLGLAVAVGLFRLAPTGAGGAGVGVGLGVAAWLLCYQVVVPAANLTDPDRPAAVPILPIGVGVAALTVVIFFLLDRRARNVSA